MSNLREILSRYKLNPQSGFYCNNANSAIAANTWNQFKFDEYLTGLEDMHLARLVEDQGKIGYIAEAKVTHIHHETWTQVQLRFEKALALKQIYPEVFLRRRDLFHYFSRGVMRDLVSAFPATMSLSSFVQIILYRYHQYMGSYRGNHLHRKMSSELRESYFYPTISKTTW